MPPKINWMNIEQRKEWDETKRNQKKRKFVKWYKSMGSTKCAGFRITIFRRNRNMLHIQLCSRETHLHFQRRLGRHIVSEFNNSQCARCFMHWFSMRWCVSVRVCRAWQKDTQRRLPNSSFLGCGCGACALCCYIMLTFLPRPSQAILKAKGRTQNATTQNRLTIKTKQ